MNVNGSSLAQGLQFYMTADLMDTNLVTGDLGLVNGTVLPQDSAKGPALFFNNSIANYIQFPNISLITQPFSVFARIWNPANVAGTESILSFGGSGGSGRGWTIRTQGTGIVLTFGGVANYSLSPTLPNTHFWDIAVSVTASAITPCVNGELSSSTACGTVTTPASTPLVIGQAHNGAAYLQPASVSRTMIASIWNRALSNDELVAMCIDPYSVLDSGSPTGAGGVPAPFARFDGNPFAGVS